MKKTSKEEDFLKNYDIEKYDRPSIATDIAVFTIMADEEDNYRKLPEQKLKILLIRRGTHPYQNAWALPGGFARKDETIRETAARELYEETHIERAYMELVDVYSDKGRDPRGWVISNTFMALMDGNKCRLHAGDDAGEAQWFDIELKKETEKRDYIKSEDSVELEIIYSLKLCFQDIKISCRLRETKLFKEYHESVHYEILESDGLAFDHAMIIVCALKKLRSHAEIDGKIVFNLMPEYFTLTQLQKAFEIILDEELLAANFRRKIAELVNETDKVMEGAGHRPAKLFKRNVEAFCKSGK
ncbi:NUDIX hydrolase [Konateibacter massiliensis]|uniref:NUDIX hydrolase n=1 Tax=Konateibacter massiliensis TaxID=2002841 RepID=UPI000C1531DD|nr:NUDIX hydrolase [Konateibacter massiliensis]